MSRRRIRRGVMTILLLSAVAVLLASCQSSAGAGRGAYYPAPTGTVPIMGRGSKTVPQLASFLLREHPEANAQEVLMLAEMYVEEARIEGVDHDVAFCQMCHETNYLRFDGDVRRHQNNFAGIGATGGGVPGDSFPDERTGIRAQIQHLKAYASTKRLRRRLVDPRFWRVRRGSALYVENLTRKWATDPAYDTKIIKIYHALAAQPY
ncbi:MAG: glucosaminidase domain-containing protein [Phycisphaerales bacterium]|nr:MAG: glucosaminidase domain-containing protein [Phycisphaerales bacterium]